MNIDALQKGEVGADVGIRQAAKAAGVGRTGASAGAKSASRSDRVDMSVISKVMAKSIRDLADDLEPRQEILDAYRGFVDRDADLSDKAIDRIMDRIAG